VDGTHVERHPLPQTIWDAERGVRPFVRQGVERSGQAAHHRAETLRFSLVPILAGLISAPLIVAGQSERVLNRMDAGERA